MLSQLLPTQWEQALYGMHLSFCLLVSPPSAASHLPSALGQMVQRAPCPAGENLPLLTHHGGGSKAF